MSLWHPGSLQLTVKIKTSRLAVLRHEVCCVSGFPSEASVFHGKQFVHCWWTKHCQASLAHCAALQIMCAVFQD